ncbi:DEAD/DEAH box helicase [Bosea sp. CS1GBMeth4]|uniref:DEAD/DEAH box helicase n=1 Tax=Bosea sp. CS1GBMeth4 TaxID=1892849 RepID=UPI00164894F5|nr:DEAD/DEAH box helicase [Bosea sp. CS1GBMeth4]
MSFISTSAPLARALADRNYSEPTPVQAAVLEAAAAGRDLLVSSQTGSGKTVAYGLAIGADLMGAAETLPRAERPLALIVAPTRELALQVQRELAWLYGEAKARIIACVGGMDPRREAMLLAEGAHIVVGTPGRLRDHLDRGQLDLSALKAVVLDEADEMLDLGFRDDLEFILQAAPAERRSLLFSATLPKAIIALARSYQRDALRIEVAGSEGGHADIEYRAIRVYPRESELAVVNLLRFYDAPCALVFCNTRNAVRHLEAALLERGFAAVSLSGELSQSERNSALQALRDGRARICVATDVAARGIDLPGLTLVIHAELPNDPEVMQHRSGRTGRAGKKGISALLVPPSRRRKAQMLLAGAGVEAEWAGAPTRDQIRALDQERLLQDPLLSGEAGEDDAGMIGALLAGRSAEELAAALVRVYRARLPATEEVGDPGFAHEERRPARSAEDYAQKRTPGERERGERSGPRGETVWFRLSTGRKDGADPRKLLPMLCRRGQITRDEVGAIRIFDRETKVEIDADVAERFAELTRVPDRDRITIEPVTGEAERRPAKPFAEKPSHVPRGARPPRDERPARKPQEGRGKPFGAKPYDPTRRDREPAYEETAILRPERPSGRGEQGKPGAGPFKGGKKPYPAPHGGERQGESRPAGKSFGGKKPYGGKKPFAGKKPRRDDR